ncbi:MAG: bifunctional 3-deoxy-7-phosphoheptulonate synthase/chorismate mutase type II [Bacteroidota bacterium]
MMNLRKPTIIAGPCSAESEEQVMVCAKALASTGKVNAFRAGIWKPRTRPGSYEGVGSEGLKWLKQVKQETGLKTATEVATEKHVYEAMKYGVDIMWIGARTSGNPFSMQEIAGALSGVDVTVFVKNPVNPDVELWHGAFERIQKAGIKNIGLIHRGFTSYEKLRYKNQPLWQLPIEMKRRLPNVPMICDPSHIAGNRDDLLEISQKALDLDYDGLMIEVHPAPDLALSDARQQIMPSQLVELLSQLICRDQNSTNINFIHVLEELRAKVDRYDENLIELLGHRMAIAKEIGRYKKENNITILQKNRWEKIINMAEKKAEHFSLSKEFIDIVFNAIHIESINNQNTIMNDQKLL